MLKHVETNRKGRGFVEEIFNRIELLRQMMHEKALEKGISHPEVLKISQKLDVVLNECYKLSF